MKRGFTLVELAIVLVVIGLLMGMAFKGKSLVDAARIKSEINKIEKISTAVNVYYSKYDTLPGLAAVNTGGVNCQAGSSCAVYRTLIDEGLLKDSDFKSSAYATYWNFTGCDSADGIWNTGTGANVGVRETAGVCIYRSSDKPTDGPKLAPTVS